MNSNLWRATRRDILKFGAVGAAAAMMPAAMTTRAIAAGNGAFKIIHSSPASLLLWSVTYLAEDMGYYKEEGLDVERVGLNGGPAAMTGLLTGNGNVNVSAPGELLSANAKGQRVKVLEGYTTADAYDFVVTKAFAAELRITADSSLADRQAALAKAKGRRFGITAPGSQTDLTTRIALRQVGLDPNGDVQIVPMGNILNVFTGLSQGAVEGGVLLAPFTQQAGHEFGTVTLLSVTKGDLPEASKMQGQVLEARPEDVEANPDAYAAFVKADLRALRMIKEAPDEARDKLRTTRFSKLPEELWPAIWASQLPTFDNPRVTPDKLRAWIETGSIGGNPDPQTFPYDKVIDMRFVEKGLADLGWSI
ncbi:ABC transporter substrate-binding protein [Sinorhizobium fredii]|uniref:ABC transporter substrate-binding protein n=1 Tax=Rhizobium fredii TaxID=380 RepID=UPI0005955E9F|nr:ABC transporter substrate-binding protein [Sinorhizobium fredii]WOS65492.1 ABC transporter substrate-binding protein [Sinorhizobium fredii GR64]